MKKRIFLFVLLTLSFLASFGQKDISGVYCNRAGISISIEGTQLNYIYPKQHSPIWYKDTLATCTFNWINDNFVELNSTPPYIIVQKGFKIVQSENSAISDSMKVSFSIPYQRGNLTVSVSTNTFKTFNLSYSEKNKELTIPNNIESISLYIFPDHPREHTSDGLFYGIVGLDFMEEYSIIKGTNRIEISIPAIDDSFFEKYYVKGEYAKVSKDSMTWKGEVFIRKDSVACF